MDDFFYPHHALIRRMTGEQDENGDEVFEVIYDGIAGVQVGGSGDKVLQDGIYQELPKMITPATDIIFKTNDMVIATMANEEEVGFTIRSSQTYEWDDVKGTTLWLKNGTGL